jgi:hypothetical protein
MGVADSPNKRNMESLNHAMRSPARLSALKVPKREIFDRSDFPDFYTIKSIRVGDFGVKIKNLFTNI